MQKILLKTKIIILGNINKMTILKKKKKLWIQLIVKKPKENEKKKILHMSGHRAPWTKLIMVKCHQVHSII